jgi:hypothetical protein
MTDLVCEYEPWKGGLVHKGMKVIRDNIAESNLVY